MAKNIIVTHHTAVSYTKNANQYDAVNNYHTSLGWGMIGYHWFIEKDGTVKKGRKETDDGAHCKEQNMNRLSIGVCLCGHFDEEEPTKEQYISLAKLIEEIEGRNGACALYPHNYFANYKSCPGKNFDFNQLTLEAMDQQTVEAVREKQANGIAENISAYWNMVKPEHQAKVAEAKKLILEANK